MSTILHLASHNCDGPPPCPSWCVNAPHGWDSTEDDGRNSRSHDGGGWPAVPEGVRGYDSVHVYTAAWEVEGRGLAPMHVEMEANCVSISAADARRVAAALLEAADRCDKVNR